MKTAGLSGHRLYDLRHPFATTLLANGAPITYVAAQLGHSKSTTTLAWYAHWLPKNDRGYVDALRRRFNPLDSRAPLDFRDSRLRGCQMWLSNLKHKDRTSSKCLILLVNCSRC